jgi:hypothetical protein
LIWGMLFIALTSKPYHVTQGLEGKSGNRPHPAVAERRGRHRTFCETHSKFLIAGSKNNPIPKIIAMSVGFGFSVGDFIAAIELVTTVIDALQASGTARAEYRELVSQLRSLETVLLHVKRLDGEEEFDEVIALRQAASQCQRTIEEFWTKASKQHPGLRGCGSRFRLKDSWME